MMDRIKNGKAEEILFQNSAVVLLIVLLVFFSILQPRVFLSPLNLRNIVSQNTYILVVAIGLSFIMVGGGIDFSIGYQISFISAVFGALSNMGASAPLIWLAVLLTGAACGALNGWLVSHLHIVPYIATFISQMVFRGAANLLYYGKVLFQVQNDYRVLVRHSFLGFQMDVWIALLCVILLSLVSSYTVFGKVVRAIGETKNNRSLIDMNTKMVEFLTYVIAGICYAIAAVILSSKQGITSTGSGMGIELTSVMIVFLSGEFVLSDKHGRRVGNIRAGNIIAATLCVGVISNGVLLTYGKSYIEHLALFVIALIMIERRRIFK